jgi:hypothetical protein
MIDFRGVNRGASYSIALLTVSFGKKTNDHSSPYELDSSLFTWFQITFDISGLSTP